MALTVELTVSPHVAGIDTPVELTGRVCNTGDTTVDTEVWQSKLYINHELSDDWAWAIANGIRSAAESALPPGECVRFQRVLPAAGLFPKPGRYEVVLEVKGQRSEAIQVERR